MKRKKYLACLLICAGLAIVGCSKEDKSADASETEVSEEVVDFDTQAETVPETEPVIVEESAPAPEPESAPVEEVPVAEEPVSAPEEAPAQEPAATEASSDYTVEETGETTLYTTDTLNMRKGPSSADFEIVGKLQKGSQITSTGKVNGYKGDGKVWYRIKRSDSSEPAFVIAEYVSAEKPVKNDTKTDAQAAPAAADATAQTDAQAKAAADAQAKALADAQAKALADAQAKQTTDAAATTPAATDAAATTPAATTPAATTPAAAPVAAPAADSPKNGHKYPDSKIAADWDRTGANTSGKKWAELDEGTKEACRTHYDDHGCSGW